MLNPVLQYNQQHAPSLKEPAGMNGTEASKPLIIRLEALSKSYQEAGRSRSVLDELNREFYAGEFICLLGKSGSGKSTLLNLISGIDDPSSGHVVICNGPDEVACQAGRPSTMTVLLEAVAVPTIQPILGAKPDEPLAVLQHTHDRVLRQALRDRNVVEVHRPIGRPHTRCAQAEGKREQAGAAHRHTSEIGRASCRERVCYAV